MNTLLKLSSMLFLTLLMGCNMSGCGLFNTEPIVDTETSEEGQLVLLDTPRNWRDFKATVDLQVSNEKADKSPPGVTTWEEHWLQRIEKNEASRENASKYVAYIIEARRAAGLPELE